MRPVFLICLAVASFGAILVACGTDQPVVVEPSSTTSTPTTVAREEPTTAPTAVETVAFVPPTLPPEEVLPQTLRSSADVWNLLGLTSIKPVPENLLPDSEPVESEELVEAWTAYLEDSMVIVSGERHLGRGYHEMYDRDFGDTSLLFCAGGNGLVINVPPADDPATNGQTFAWGINHSVASPWYRPILLFQMRDPQTDFDIDSDINFGTQRGLPGTLSLQNVDMVIVGLKDPDAACADLEGFSQKTDWRFSAPEIGGKDILTHE